MFYAPPRSQYPLLLRLGKYPYPLFPFDPISLSEQVPETERIFTNPSFSTSHLPPSFYIPLLTADILAG